MISPRPIHAATDPSPWDVSRWDVKGWAAFFGLVGVVVGGMGWGWKKIVRPFFHHLNNVRKMPDRIEQLCLRQTEIHQRLLSAEGRTRQVFDTLPHPLWESDADGRTIFANRYMLELLGVQFGDIAGEGWRTVVHPEDRPEVFEAWEEAVELNHDFVLDYRWMDSHQRPIPVSVLCRRITDGQQTIGFIGHVTLVFGQSTTRDRNGAPLNLRASQRTDD